MVDLFSNEGKIIKLQSVSNIPDDDSEFILMQFQDYSEQDLEWVRSKFNIDLSILNNVEDIEISSHFIQKEGQSSFHFSIPYFKHKDVMVEDSFFLILTDDKIFAFTTAAQDEYFSQVYEYKFHLQEHRFNGVEDLFIYLIQFLADYYADVTENIAKKVKQLASRVLVKNQFKNDDLDIITQLNFNNLLIKESINEYVRILTIQKKQVRQLKLSVKEMIDEELNDLSIVSDYIQFNFDRLDDLKENVGNKIELEQNRIFKLLTVVTFCISMPTLIAGIYGMNFQNMPGVNSSYGYAGVLSVMALSVVIPLVYFKKRRWL